MLMKSEEYILLDEIVREFSVSRGTVNRWCAKGELDKIGRGCDAYTTKKSFDAFIEKRERTKTMLTLTQISEITGLSIDALRYLIKKGELKKTVRVDGVDYFEKDCVDRLIKTGHKRKHEKKAHMKDDDEIWKCDDLDPECITWNAFLSLGAAVIRSLLRKYKIALREGRPVQYYENWLRGSWFVFYSADMLNPEYIIGHYRERYWRER